MTTRRTFASSVALGAFAGLVALVVVWLRTPLLGGSLDVPLIDADDGLFYQAQIEALREPGGLGDVQRLGAPFGTSLLDIPSADFTHLAVLGLLVRLVSPAVAFNLFYLQGFFTSALTATMVARRERIHPTLAVAVGVLFAIAPYHFLRLSHLYLAQYAAVPLAVAAALDLGRGAPRTLRAMARPRGSLGLSAATLVLSGTGLYYAFFACAIGLAATVKGAFARGSRAPLRAGALYLGFTTLGVILQLAPTLARQRVLGPSMTGVRAPWESELYGLKPVQLLWPTPGHPIHALSRFAERYAGTAPITNENTTAALGVLGVLGLGIALTMLAFGFGRARTRELGWHSVVAIAVGTVGGLGTLFAYAVHPGIRSVNRVSIVIAFLALLALARTVQARIARRRGSRSRRAWLVVASVFAIAFASFDQVPTRGYRDDHAEARFRRDVAFFRRLEARLPQGASVLLHPHTAFPEGARRVRFGAYDGLRLFLHTRALRSSAGAVTGREAEVWLTSAIRESAERRVALSARAGFDAILVGRAGLRTREGRDPIFDALGEPIAANADWLAFRLPSAPPATPPFVANALGRGFLGWERLDGRRRGTWADRDAEILLVHTEPRALVARVSMRLSSVDRRTVVFRVGRRVVHRVTLAPNEPRPIAFDVRVERGATRLSVSSDHGAVDPGNGDLRDLAFGISDLVTVERPASADAPAPRATR